MAEAIDNVAGQEGLELLKVVSRVQRHLRNNISWLLLTDQVVKEETLDADTDVRGGYNSSLWSLPINPPVVNKWNWEESFSASDDIVSNEWHTSIKRQLNSVFDHLSHSTDKEHLEKRANIRNEVSKQVNVDVESVNVALDINCGDLWHNLTATHRLSRECNADLNIHGVHVNLSVTFGNNKWQNLVSEFAAPELSGNFLVCENHGVFVDISGELDVVLGLHDFKCVLLEVITILVFNVRQLKIIDKLENLFEIHILGLVDHRDVKRRLKTSLNISKRQSRGRREQN